MALEDGAEDFVAHLIQAVGQDGGVRVETYAKPPPPQPRNSRQIGRPALNTGTLFCKCPSNPTPYFTIRVRKPGRATDAYSEMNRNAASLDELAPLDLANASTSSARIGLPVMGEPA